MSETIYLEYGTKEIEYLKSKDSALGKIIEEIGLLNREVIPDLFMALLNSIIGQQISTKAQETIWLRFQAMFQPVTAEAIALIPNEELQKCGISLRKTAYIKGIANEIAEGRLDLDKLQAMPDEEVIERLSRLNGVGVWTAEMLMIFSMQRMDILSWNDLAIHRGLRMLYRHREITAKLFEKYKKRYSPYGTVASLYLWRISHGDCAGLTDPAKSRVKKK